MVKKKYEEAINLFSKKQQENIKKIKENKETFDLWCLAWTMNDLSFEGYKSRIKNGGGTFVFEDGMWKIDEK